MLAEVNVISLNAILLPLRDGLGKDQSAHLNCLRENNLFISRSKVKTR